MGMRGSLEMFRFRMSSQAVIIYVFLLDIQHCKYSYFLTVILRIGHWRFQSPGLQAALGNSPEYAQARFHHWAERNRRSPGLH